jgi:CelD/BcsL family acetyltransferase involved in cellulose biosynthesis
MFRGHPRTTPKLQVAVVTSDSEFAALEAAWNAAARRSLTPSVFLSHEWFRAAWAWRRLDSSLHLHVARRGNTVCGVLPLIRRLDTQGSWRRLELLTVPDTQMSDLLAAPTDLADVTDAFAAALGGQRDWDVLELNYLLPHSALIKAFGPSILLHGLLLEECSGGRNPFVGLDGTWSDYYDARSRRLKKANNLAANRLKKTGEIRIDWLRSASCDGTQFPRAIDTVIDVSGRSWKRDTGNALDKPGPQAFIRSLSQAARDRGWLSIWLMYVDGRPLAMEYQLIDDRNIHALRSDFDASCEDISPGTYLFRQLLESSFGRGLQRYYMGPGDNPYKLRWTDRAEPLRRMIVYNHTLRGRLAWFRDTVVKPLLRTVRDRYTSKLTDHSHDGSSASQDHR